VALPRNEVSIPRLAQSVKHYFKVELHRLRLRGGAS